MDYLGIVYSSALTALVGGVVGAVVATAVSYVKEKKKGADSMSEAMRQAMLALLWRELKNLHAEAMEKGGMTIEERRHMESVYEPYHAMNGNGTGTRLYEEAMLSPVIE